MPPRRESHLGFDHDRLVFGGVDVLLKQDAVDGRVVKLKVRQAAPFGTKSAATDPNAIFPATRELDADQTTRARLPVAGGADN